MILIGLTGGIGMGKSTTAAMFAEQGLPIWDADAAVHRLYAAGAEGAKMVGRRFPDVLNEEGAVDRVKLATHLTAHPDAWSDLNHIVHPLVAADRRRFIAQCGENKNWAVVCDIPLLFETGGDEAMDVSVVCSSPEEIRRERVMLRPGMTAEKYVAIVANQMPDAEKRARADFIVETHRGLDHARAAVRLIVDALRSRESDQNTP